MNNRYRQDVLQQQAEHNRKAAFALKEWQSASPADPQHPYLVSHCLPPFNLRQIQHPVYGWCLLVPLCNEQLQLRNNERINPDGMKRPIKGAQKKGCFYQFGKQTYTVYVCEGWSTGAAIHLNKPFRPCVLTAMSANNLESVTSTALQLYPDSDIVIAADHDPTGIKTAVSVAAKYGLKIVLPEGQGNDFCDLHIQAAGRAHHEH